MRRMMTVRVLVPVGIAEKYVLYFICTGTVVHSVLYQWRLNRLLASLVDFRSVFLLGFAWPEALPVTAEYYPLV